MTIKAKALQHLLHKGRAFDIAGAVTTVGIVHYRRGSFCANSLVLGEWGICLRLRTELFEVGASRDSLGLTLALACAGSFAVAMTLIGVSPYYGAFYVTSMLTGFLLAARLRPGDFCYSRSVVVFSILILTLMAFFVQNVLATDAAPSQLDNFSRIILGSINGGFFIALFGRQRDRLYGFIVAIALAHAMVAILVAFFESLPGETLRMTVRAGGDTNPIPFSEMLAISAGIVAIAAIGYRSAFPSFWRLPLLVGFLAMALGALILTGSRGTLIVIFPLAILMAAAREKPLHPLGVLAAIGVILVIGAALSPFVFSRMSLLFADAADLLAGEGTGGLSNSVRIRIDLWSHALELASRRPMLGYGLGSFPQVLKDPSLAIPADSPLWHFNHVHNQYLDLLLETGLIGLGLFMSVIGISLWAGFRALRDPPRRIIGLTLIWVASSYSIFGLSTTFMAHSTTSHHFGVLIGMLFWCVAYRDDRGWTFRGWRDAQIART